MESVAETLKGKYVALHELYEAQLRVTPQYRKSLEKRLKGATAEDLEAAEFVARQIKLITGTDLQEVLSDYDWICRRMVEEEFYFRRNGRYRLSTFDEALEQVYSNDAFMRPYMNGLLVSHLWWSNHTNASRFYSERFLGGFTNEFDHLEIGPGHGLLLGQAVNTPLCCSVEAWDISESSINATRRVLERLGVSRSVKLVLCDLFDELDPAARFDSIVFSEVLEHMERPREALERIHSLLDPGGRLYVNVPVNSPAPDHLFLLRSPEEAVEFLENCGFNIEEAQFFPQTNLTLEEAREKEATISVVIIANPA